MRNLFFLITIMFSAFIGWQMLKMAFKDSRRGNANRQFILDQLKNMEWNYQAIYNQELPPSNDFERSLLSLSELEFEDFIVSKWREKGKDWYEYRLSISNWEKEVRQMAMQLPVNQEGRKSVLPQLSC